MYGLLGTLTLAGAAYTYWRYRTEKKNLDLVSEELSNLGNWVENKIKSDDHSVDVVSLQKMLAGKGLTSSQTSYLTSTHFLYVNGIDVYGKKLRCNSPKIDETYLEIIKSPKVLYSALLGAAGVSVDKLMSDLPVTLEGAVGAGVVGGAIGLAAKMIERGARRLALSKYIWKKRQDLEQKLKKITSIDSKIDPS